MATHPPHRADSHGRFGGPNVAKPTAPAPWEHAAADACNQSTLLSAKPPVKCGVVGENGGKSWCPGGHGGAGRLSKPTGSRARARPRAGLAFGSCRRSIGQGPGKADRRSVPNAQPKRQDVFTINDSRVSTVLSGQKKRNRQPPPGNCLLLVLRQLHRSRAKHKTRTPDPREPSLRCLPAR